MADLEISLSVLFTFLVLIIVTGVFCFVWSRQRVKNRSRQSESFDASKWLLVCLTVVAFIVMVGSLLLILFENSYK
jgi:nicotinamide riboside transporter PnuC